MKNSFLARVLLHGEVEFFFKKTLVIKYKNKTIYVRNRKDDLVIKHKGVKLVYKKVEGGLYTEEYLLFYRLMTREEYVVPSGGII